jgi:hypothetical protein
VGPSNTIIVPLGASTLIPASWVSGRLIESKTISAGSLVILAISEEREDRGTERGMMCVAPKDWSSSVLCAEAVTMIGEKPESRANWIAVEVEN